MDCVNSPTGVCYAEIIENDQGEKGSSKLVNVYTGKDIQNPVFVIRKKPIKIYEEFYKSDEADEKTVDLRWKDDTHLVINGKDYSF